MKKFIFGAAVVAAAGFGTFTANQNNNQALLSDLQLENVEVFGQDVEPDTHVYTGRGAEEQHLDIIVIDGRPRYYRHVVICHGNNPSDCHPVNETIPAMKEE